LDQVVFPVHGESHYLIRVGLAHSDLDVNVRQTLVFFLVDHAYEEASVALTLMEHHSELIEQVLGDFSEVGHWDYAEGHSRVQSQVSGVLQDFRALDGDTIHLQNPVVLVVSNVAPFHIFLFGPLEAELIHVPPSNRHHSVPEDALGEVKTKNCVLASRGEGLMDLGQEARHVVELVANRTETNEAT
jgi:hypothetical protein